jgi:hypothetical protein
MSVSFPRGRIACLIPLLLLTFACGGRGPEPLSVVPADARAVVGIASARVLAKRLAPTMTRLPEAVGALDLVRSLVGIDLRDPDGCRQEGLDPDRGLAIALHGDALLVVLPVGDQGSAGRRLGLRLARLGLVETDPVGDVRRFSGESDDGMQAALRVERRLAVACFGPVNACDDLALLPLVGPGADLSPALDELSMSDADLVGRVSNRALLELADRLGLPGSSAGMVGTMLGDLRFAVSLSGGVTLRAAVGAVADPFTSTLSGEPPEDAALRLSVHAGDLPAPWIRQALSLLFGARSEMPGRLAGWDGRLLLTLHALKAERVTPLLSPRGLLGMAVDALAGFRSEAAVAGVLVEAVRLLSGAGADVDAVDGDPARGISFTGPGALAGFAGRTGAVGWWTSGQGAAGRALAWGGRPDAGRKALESVPRRLVRIEVDPGALIEASGVTAVDFVRHMASGVRSIQADLAMEGLRFVVDAAVRVR